MRSIERADYGGSQSTYIAHRPACVSASVYQIQNPLFNFSRMIKYSYWIWTACRAYRFDFQSFCLTFMCESACVRACVCVCGARIFVHIHDLLVKEVEREAR